MRYINLRFTLHYITLQWATSDCAVCWLVCSGCTDGTVCVWTVRQPGTTCTTPTLTTASKVCHLHQPSPRFNSHFVWKCWQSCYYRFYQRNSFLPFHGTEYPVMCADVPLGNYSFTPRERLDGTHCLWPPYGIGQAIYIFILSFGLSFFSLPNLSHHRLDVYHTSTHGVIIVRI